MTERYVHAAQVAFPGAADRSEERLFSGVPRSAGIDPAGPYAAAVVYGP